MSASLRTRDGSFSVAGAILAKQKASDAIAEIDMSGALEWAHDNKVNVARAKRPIEAINAARARSKLPRFQIIRSEEKVDPASAPEERSAAPAQCPVVGSREELNAQIANFTGTLTGLVTPEIAAWLLEMNTQNRPINHKAVDRFRRILSAGGWVNTGEPIIVSSTAILNDGQHRLSAIRASGIAAELDIRFGIDRAAFRATGTGRRRTAGDVLSMEGYRNTSCQAAIARLLYHYDHKQMGQHRAQVEVTDILRMIETDDRICEIAAHTQRSKFRPTRAGSFGFVLVVAARTAPLDRVFEFADLVASGLVQDEADPARRLHVRLRDSAMKKEPLGQLDAAVLTVKAWNAWVQQQTLPSLRVLEGDRTSTGFPEIREWPAGGIREASAASCHGEPAS